MEVPRLQAGQWVGAAFLFAAVFVARISSTTFQRRQGPDEFVGQGGAFHTRDGIDVYTDGAPNRLFRVLEVIDKEVYGSTTAVVLLGNQWSESAIVSQTKKQGGGAVILVWSEQEIAGYASSYSYAGGMGSGGGSTRTLASKKAVVIKYLDDGDVSRATIEPSAFDGRLYKLSTGEVYCGRLTYSGTGKGRLKVC